MREKEQARLRWEERTKHVERITSQVRAETPEERTANVRRARSDYAYFCSRYFPHYCKCRNGKFQNEAARYVKSHPDTKAVFMWPRGHAKSTHFDIMIPLWLKFQEPSQLHVMVVVGKSEDSADVLLSDLQAELQFNRYLIEDFGIQHNSGSWEEGEFVTRDGAAFFSRGRGQSPRGLRYRESRPDYIIIDDLDDDELCRSESRVRILTDWVKEALFGALDGGRGRFIMVGNLIGKCSVLNNIARAETVHLSRIDAIDKEGKPVWIEKYSREEMDQMAAFMGYRAFQKEMMNNPIVEGTVFRQDWIRWKKPCPLARYDYLIAYCDPSFKSTGKNDYKAVKVWGKKATELHCLFAFVRQCSISEMVRWLYDLHERFPSDVICDYFMEANFMQDMILDEFALEGKLRGYQLPIRGDKRQKPDKFARIEAISPLWERGFVFYNENRQTDKDMLTAIEQTLAFEKGAQAHDDAPDADEGAIYILQKKTRTEAFTPRFGRRQSPKNSY
jgi:predicted phage terminase large subunit-like protein